MVSDNRVLGYNQWHVANFAQDGSPRTLGWEGKFLFKIQFRWMGRVVLISTHDVMVASQRRILF